MPEPVTLLFGLYKLIGGFLAHAGSGAAAHAGMHAAIGTSAAAQGAGTAGGAASAVLAGGSGINSVHNEYRKERKRVRTGSLRLAVSLTLNADGKRVEMSH